MYGSFHHTFTDTYQGHPICVRFGFVELEAIGAHGPDIAVCIELRIINSPICRDFVYRREDDQDINHLMSEVIHESRHYKSVHHRELKTFLATDFSNRPELKRLRDELARGIELFKLKLMSERQ